MKRIPVSPIPQFSGLVLKLWHQKDVKSMKPVFVSLAAFKTSERNENVRLEISPTTFEDMGAQATFTFWDQGYVCIRFLRSKLMQQKVYTLQCIGSDDRGRACDEYYAKPPSFEALTAKADLFIIHWEITYSSSLSEQFFSVFSSASVGSTGCINRRASIIVPAKNL